MAQEHSHSPAPHDKFMGLLIATVIVGIVFDGIFSWNPWWAVLVRLILAISLIVEFFKFINNREVRANYRYNTTQKELLNIWIAAIIVNVAMHLIFHGLWVGQIPSAVLMIKAIEITILYLVTVNQQRKLQAQVNIHSVVPIVVPINSGTQDIGQTVVLAVQSQYCSQCGAEHGEVDEFCARCGSKLR
jgi:zinc-ribbon domain